MYAFIFCFLVAGFTYGQDSVTRQTDTLSLARFENVVLKTNNGSDCTCLINNPSRGQSITITVMGAPANVRFDNDSIFNSIHILGIQEQLIALDDFMGTELTIANLSPYESRVLIYFFCPK